MSFDYMSPDYTAIFIKRAALLKKLEDDPDLLRSVKIHYRYHPWDFINDWGMTFDPRNVELGLISNMPFLTWDKQVEYLKWLYGQWQGGERGLVEKSRDCGVSWLSVGFAVSLWCFEPGISIGFGSRDEDSVDTLGDPDSIFEKLRHFVQNLPSIFLPDGFVYSRDSSKMKLLSPDTGASITGDAGPNIGRGGRKSIYFVDEAAFILNQKKVDAALSNTTNCQIDISTFNGAGNPFYHKQQRFYGTSRHFIFDWRDDPRKDEVWYQKQKDEQSEETVAQEIDRDPNAANTDSFIPAKWVSAAIDSHIAFGFAPEGIRITSFDPADTGDAKAIGKRHGIVLLDAVERNEGDIVSALPWAYEEAELHRSDVFIYDADGMGGPTVRVDLDGKNLGRIKVVEYYGSAKVKDPDEPSVPSDRKSKLNKDKYYNYRAQMCSMLRERFRRTYDARQRLDKGLAVNVSVDQIISLSSGITHLKELKAELSIPKRIFRDDGKILCESKKAMKSRGVKSPNLFDVAVMAYSTNEIPDFYDEFVDSFEPDFEN